LTKNEATVLLIFSGKIFIGMQKLVFLYQAKFLKEVRMDKDCKMKLPNVLKVSFLSEVTMRLFPVKLIQYCHVLVRRHGIWIGFIECL
jgi:hypothetical protein